MVECRRQSNPAIIGSSQGLPGVMFHKKRNSNSWKSNPARDFAMRDDMKNVKSFVRVAASAGLAVVLGFLCLAPLRAHGKAPTFVVDPAWPKPLPNLWVTGGVGGVCIDSRAHVFILN